MATDKNKTLTPTVIPENQFPGKPQITGQTTANSTQETFYPSEISGKSFPVSITASRLLSSTLDTQRRQIMGGYTFTQMGAITIGNYRNGIGSGISISPTGLVGVNNGVTKFAIDNQGNATFAGTITAGVIVATGALIVGTNVGIGTAFPTASAGDMAYEDLVEKAKLGTTIIQGGYIKTDLLTADNIITGTLIGINIQSGTGTERIVLNNGNYFEFYSGGVLKGKFRPGTAGLGMVAELGSYITRRDEGFYSSSSTSTFTDFSKFGSRNLSPYGNITVIELLANNKFGIFDSGASTALFTINASGDTYSERRYSSGADNIGFASNLKLTIHADAEVDERVVTDLVSGSYPRIYFPDRPGENSGKKGIQFGNGENFAINNGSTIKNAILKTDKFGYRALACIESPEVWFMDFTGEDKILDPMFEAVTEGDCEWIKTKRGYQVWRRRINLSGIRFEEKTEAQFIKNEQFLSIPHQKD